MENKVKLLIELGLQRDEDQGDVAVVAFDLPRSVAERVCREQESCQLLSECGDLTRLLNAYAVMNGYQCAWFISATMQDDSADALIEENAELRESVPFLQTELEVADAERADAVRGAIYRMRDELKTGRIHFDGISLKAIPFDSVDAVAERIIKEIADGK